MKNNVFCDAYMRQQGVRAVYDAYLQQKVITLISLS